MEELKEIEEAEVWVRGAFCPSHFQGVIRGWGRIFEYGLFSVTQRT